MICLRIVQMQRSIGDSLGRVLSQPMSTIVCRSLSRTTTIVRSDAFNEQRRFFLSGDFL